MTKGWKQALLSSGVPLEHSVRGVLEELGINQPREYPYVRINENGVPTAFSVDIIGAKIRHRVPQLWIDFTIECKYRRDGTRWIFAPANFEKLLLRDFRDMICTLEALNPSHMLNAELRSVAEFPRIAPLCSGASEVTVDGKSNPNSIAEALHQLRYAVGPRLADAMKFQYRNRDAAKFPPPISVFPLIVVTTAELWRLREDVGLDGVRSADELKEIAEQVPAVSMQLETDRTLRKHTADAIRAEFPDSTRATLDEIYAGTGLLNFENALRRVSNYHPRHFFLVNFSDLGDVLEAMIAAFPEDAIIERPQQTIGVG